MLDVFSFQVWRFWRSSSSVLLALQPGQQLASSPRSVFTALHISDLRVLQLAWYTWRSRRVCTCPHHFAVRHRKGSIAMLAMALLVCFSTGSGSSFLVIFWKDIGHVLGLRIVGLGRGGCQAQGLSVAWLHRRHHGWTVAKVPFRLLKSFQSFVVFFAFGGHMSLVFGDKFSQATDQQWRPRPRPPWCRLCLPG